MTRINKLVAEGKLSPEDAADLIDAFYASRGDAPPEEVAEGERQTPPPPPPGATKDPFKGLIEGIEKMAREGVDSVNWKEVSRQARESAKKGIAVISEGLGEISKGKVHIGWLGTQETREIKLPLSLGEGKTLKIENACGDVKISGGASSGSVTAFVNVRGATTEDAKAKADAFTLIVEESDHLVLVKQPDVSGLGVDLLVEVPDGTPIDLRTESGDVRVMDTRAAARVSCRSGDIKLSGLNGLIDLSTESGDVTVESTETTSLTIENKSGDIKLEGVHGTINARTASGDVRLRECGGKAIAVETVSGDVDAELDQPVAGLNIRTVSGGAEIKVPDGSDCRVSLSSLRGEVECDLDLQDEAREDQRITGRLGEGSGVLDVSAVTGDITLEYRSAEVH